MAHEVGLPCTSDTLAVARHRGEGWRSLSRAPNAMGPRSKVESKNQVVRCRGQPLIPKLPLHLEMCPVSHM